MSNVQKKKTHAVGCSGIKMLSPNNLKNKNKNKNQNKQQQKNPIIVLQLFLNATNKNTTRKF
jgi:hypothetical protein